MPADLKTGAGECGPETDHAGHPYGSAGGKPGWADGFKSTLGVVENDHDIRLPEQHPFEGWGYGYAWDPGKVPGGDLVAFVNGMTPLAQWGFRANRSTRSAAIKRARSVTKRAAGKPAGNAPAQLEEMTPDQLDVAYRRARAEQRRAFLRLEAIEQERARRFSVPGQQMPGGW